MGVEEAGRESVGGELEPLESVEDMGLVGTRAVFGVVLKAAPRCDAGVTQRSSETKLQVSLQVGPGVISG